MTPTITTLAARLASAAPAAAVNGPGDVSPDYGYFPFMGTLVNIANGVSGAVIVVLVILAVIGVVLIVAGKLGSSNVAQRVGWGILVVCVVAAAIAANAGGIINWGTQQKLV